MPPQPDFTSGKVTDRDKLNLSNGVAQKQQPTGEITCGLPLPSRRLRDIPATTTIQLLEKPV